jgi:GNAT superfamily N-acetyltransferase
MKNNLNIIEVNNETQEQAKKIILEGLAERFGFLDTTLNTDLNNIMLNYVEVGHVFLVGIFGLDVVCTGALLYENNEIGRIARMSVVKELRRQGFAQTLINELEKKALSSGIQKLVLETNRTWVDAINFYKLRGYNEDYKDDIRIHMYKNL